MTGPLYNSIARYGCVAVLGLAHFFHFFVVKVNTTKIVESSDFISSEYRFSFSDLSSDIFT